MISAHQLLSAYKQVREEEPSFESKEIAVITNELAKEDGIMLVGFNPSGKGDCVIHDFLSCQNDFFTPKHNMLGEYNAYCAYIDLFPFRQGRQNIALDEEECRFRGELLSHTRDYIESIHPRLIIYANTATRYWGFKGDWMGYTFSRIKSPLPGEKSCWPLYKITGIVPTDVNRMSSQSKLVNHSYFLRYRQHKNQKGVAVPESKLLTPDDIKILVNFIDEYWANDLLK